MLKLIVFDNRNLSEEQLQTLKVTLSMMGQFTFFVNLACFLNTTLSCTDITKYIHNALGDKALFLVSDYIGGDGRIAKKTTEWLTEYSKAK